MPRPADSERPSGVKCDARRADARFAQACGPAPHSYPGEDTIALKLPGALSAALTLCLTALAALTTPGLVTPATAGTPQPTTVSVAAPAVAQVPLGTDVALHGTVSGAGGRAARLELLTGAGWRPLGEATTDEAGDFALAVPTDWYLRGSLRVVVPATPESEGAASGELGLAVVPTYEPRGVASDWARLAAGVRWDPCAGPITWKVNPAGVPGRRLTELTQSFRLLHAATGLAFEYAGQTAAVPFRTDGRGASRSDADFTVAFSTARQVQGLAGTVVGKGGVSYRTTGEAVHGLVVLDKDARLDAGFGAGHTWGTLMLHELGHGVGLAHASGLEQAMHSGITARSRGSYQAGDLTGLARLGVAAGCLTPPSTASPAPSTAPSTARVRTPVVRTVVAQ